jgi:type I restriction enzyme S subunit
MKVGWKIKTVGQVCDVVNGGTPETGIAAYRGGPYQWITPAKLKTCSLTVYIVFAKTHREVGNERGFKNKKTVHA